MPSDADAHGQTGRRSLAGQASAAASSGLGDRAVPWPESVGPMAGCWFGYTVRVHIRRNTVSLRLLLVDPGLNSLDFASDLQAQVSSCLAMCVAVYVIPSWSP